MAPIRGFTEWLVHLRDFIAAHNRRQNRGVPSARINSVIFRKLFPALERRNEERSTTRRALDPNNPSP